MGELGTFTKGAPLSKADVTETGTPLILYGELYTTYGDIANTIVRKTDKDVKSECYSMLGDVIIPTSGESPEEISTCTCVMQDGVILAGDLNIYRTNDLDGRFLSYEINHVRNREIAKIAQGKSIVHIKVDELAKIVIRFPSKAEQSKIIELFSCLDRKIELQKELIESLKLYKRGVIEKLFPQKGESVPQYRFAGFEAAWEQRKFFELVTIERGGSPRPIEKFITKDVNGLNWVKIGDAPEQGNYITHTAEKIIPEGLSKTREVHPGDLILSNSMSFGKPYIMAIDGCIHDGWLLIRDTQKNFDLKFLCILLGTENMLNQYKAMAAGSTVNNLNKELVGGTNVSYPSLAEQSKLGEYFAHLDHLITLHQQMCNEMQSIKKFMLQNMFI